MKKQSSFSSWLSKESKTYTALCGETFTHAEVLAANAVTAGMIAVAIVAGNVLS